MPENPKVRDNGWLLKRTYDFGNEKSAAMALEEMLQDVRAAHRLGLAVSVQTHVYKARVAWYHVTISDPLSYD